MHRRQFITATAGGFASLSLSGFRSANRVQAAQAITKDQARAALRQAVAFFREKVSVEGGYLWRYSEDLEKREGENKASPTLAWVQPPGTPAVGLAFLNAFELCGEASCYDAAAETALAIRRGQLRSGGWDYRIEFDPKKRSEFAFRTDDANSQKLKALNITTFDDNTSQAALTFLLRTREAMKARQDERLTKVEESARFACESFLKAQYPNGAWPQRYSEFPDPADYPIKKATYPQTWSRTFPAAKYYHNYTFNDDSQSDLIAVMFLAGEVFSDNRLAAAAEKGGDFILLSQMPAPQPAWAQQYNTEMQPCWARKFEPPAVTGGESQGILRTLLLLYRKTGDKKYLEPIPRAIEYLRKSLLPNGRLARFYELKTNRPLYFTKQYELTYEDGDLPTHYGFKIDSQLDSIEAAYQRALAATADAGQQTSKPPVKPKMKTRLANEASSVVAALDDRGAWVTMGSLRKQGVDDNTTRIIETATFVKNLSILATFLAAE